MHAASRFSFAFYLLLAGCGVSQDAGVLPDGGHAEAPDAEVGPSADASILQLCDKMDIVFVVDDSDTMREEQENLIANFPGFIDVLNEYDTQVGDRSLDYRVAVTTTSRQFDFMMDIDQVPLPFEVNEEGDSGAFRRGCEMERPWIERDDGDPSETFSCVANVGTGGSRYEMPLLATQLAFTDRILDGSNADFLRDDALLGIVVLTDEDDCSRAGNGFTVSGDICDGPLMPTAGAIEFLDTLKGSRSRWAAAVIAGLGPGNCTSELSNAEEATRLRDFVEQTGDNAVMSSICEDDLSGALAEALETFKDACDSFEPID